MINKYNLYYGTFLFVFWTLMCFGFVADEFLPPLYAIKNPLFLLCDAVFVILGICLLRRKKDLFVFISFLAISVISTIVLNHLSLVTYINGFREFIGLIFAVPVVYFFLSGENGREFKEKFDRQLKILLIIQAFCVTWQFLKYGAGDHGGGSMGNYNSGTISYIIYFTSFYLTLQNWDFDNYFQSLIRNKWNIILLYPTFLNETKVSFLLLILYFILLYRPDRTTFIKLIYIIPLSCLALYIILKLYLTAVGVDFDYFSGDFFYEYLVGLSIDDTVALAQSYQDGEFDIDQYDMWLIDLPRFAKIVFMGDALDTTPGGLWFGAGLGQFKGGTFFDLTRFAREYGWLLNGTRPWLFFIVIQLGILGIVWQCVALGVQILQDIRKRLPSIRIILYFLFGFVILLFYSDSLRILDLCIVMFYVVIATKITGNNAEIESSEK